MLETSSSGVAERSYRNVRSQTHRCACLTQLMERERVVQDDSCPLEQKGSGSGPGHEKRMLKKSESEASSSTSSTTSSDSSLSSTTSSSLSATVTGAKGKCLPVGVCGSDASNDKPASMQLNAAKGSKRKRDPSDPSVESVDEITVEVEVEKTGSTSIETKRISISILLV